MPQALVVTIAGLALLGTIGSSLSTALAEEIERDHISHYSLGVAMWDISSAFWGLILGALALLIQRSCYPKPTLNETKD